MLQDLPIVDDGNSHDYFCALRLLFDNKMSNQYKLFPQSARTRCVRPSVSKINGLDMGYAKWNELFIFEVPEKVGNKLYWVQDSLLFSVYHIFIMCSFGNFITDRNLSIMSFPCISILSLITMLKLGLLTFAHALFSTKIKITLSDIWSVKQSLK